MSLGIFYIGAKYAKEIYKKAITLEEYTTK